jgi:hypothetical protein
MSAPGRAGTRYGRASTTSAPAPTLDVRGDLAGELERLAEAISRLRPDWRDASAFYERRSDIVGALRALSRNPPATRVVTRFVQIPVPAPAQPSSPSRAPPTRYRAARSRLPHPGRPQGQGALWPSR